MFPDSFPIVVSGEDPDGTPFERVQDAVTGNSWPEVAAEEVDEDSEWCETYGCMGIATRGSSLCTRCAAR